MTLLFAHAAMAEHRGPPGHPEQPARLEAVLRAFAPLGLETRDAPMAPRVAVERVHPPAFVDALDAAFPAAGEGLAMIDADTFLSDGSREAAYRAAGALIAAVDAVLSDEADAAFCAVRPPGHHAEPAQAMGFCLFNNIAIGALHALEAHGLARVAVIDFDVHHGNGTQACALKEPRLFFASTHQAPLYPGTGFAHERGPAGNVLNIPLPAGTDGAAWRAAMSGRVLPAVEAWAPALILVSAGFDAHEADPLAQLRLTDEDYAWAGAQIRALALRTCKGKVVSALEGGYDLTALARSAAAYVGALTRD